MSFSLSRDRGGMREDDMGLGATDSRLRVDRAGDSS